MSGLVLFPLLSLLRVASAFSILGGTGASPNFIPYTDAWFSETYGIRDSGLPEGASIQGMKDYIYRVIVPEETVVEEKNGVEKQKIKKLFPGYILVEMVMSDEAWFIVRNTPGVTGFIGSSGKGAKPTPLQPYEVDHILNSMGMARIDIKNDLAIGDSIKIVDGPFSGMFGKVESINEETKQVNTVVDLFGQETTIECELSQIKKA